MKNHMDTSWPTHKGHAPNSRQLGVNVEREELIVYPNPAHNKLYFKTTSKAIRELYNALGVRLLFTKQDEMDVGSLARGVYYVRVGNVVRRVVIE